jgi:hypothetical protein
MFQLAQKTEKVEVNKAIDLKIFESQNKLTGLNFCNRYPPWYPFFFSST